MGKETSLCVNKLTAAYDSRTSGCLAAETEFIKTGCETDWQPLVNKAAKAEARPSCRDARITAYKASLASRTTRPNKGDTKALVVGSATATLDNASGALARAKRERLLQGV